MARLDDKAPTKGSLRKRLRPSIHKRLEEMWEREPDARQFENPEGVHQMRVATRKVRAALDAGSIAFSGKRFRRVQKEVRALTKALGAVRDTDVMLETLTSMQQDAGGIPRPGIQRLIGRLEHERDTARERLLQVLDRVEDENVQETSLESFTPSGKKRRLRRRDAALLISGHVQRFIDLTEPFPVEHEVEELHEVRIATKQLRYALDIARKPLRPESVEILSELKTLQDEMGEIHNLDVLIDLARRELHTLTDEEADLALVNGFTEASDTAGARADLLALLTTTGRERSRRYAELRALHDRLQADGFTDKLATLTGARN